MTSERNASTPCEANDCAGVMKDWIADGAEKGTGERVEVTVSTAPPLIASGYKPVVMKCPRGIKWYAEPTPEQRLSWTERGIA